MNQTALDRVYDDPQMQLLANAYNTWANRKTRENGTNLSIVLDETIEKNEYVKRRYYTEMAFESFTEEEIMLILKPVIGEKGEIIEENKPLSIDMIRYFMKHKSIVKEDVDARDIAKRQTFIMSILKEARDARPT